MKATAQAPANIAFIKYWGKANDMLRLPLNSSISMNLSAAFTQTTVEFSSAFDRDTVTLDEVILSDAEVARVIKTLDRIRQKTGIALKARVYTKNTFPKGTGAASSASGFAALTVAGFEALGVKYTEKDCTIFARMGSGSACRSIPDGFVLWEKGETSEDSYAYSLYPHTHWDIRDALVIVDSHMKKVSTSDGMDGVRTSPYLSKRLVNVPRRIEKMKEALRTKDFQLFGEITEEDCLDMHHVMQTQIPPIMYWNEATIRIMDAVRAWRNSGLSVYFTIDAGPNVHIIYEGKNEKTLREELEKLDGVEHVILNHIAGGTTLITDHLF